MKVSFDVIKLEFTGPLHIGRGWGDLDHSEPILHSDTIKSALFFALIQLAPEWKPKAKDFFESFHISSCFPYYENELFLPKLQLKRRFYFEGIDEHKQAKTAKKVEFLSLEIFQSYINNSKIFSVKKNQLSANKKYIFSKEHNYKINLIESQVQQRVNVKYYSDSVPFFADRLFFRKNCGLYFLATFKDNFIKNEIFKALSFLGTLGIGTDRTVGNGLFEFDENKHVSKVEIEVEKTEGYASLGLYIPKKEELNDMDLDNSSWGILPRGGYMAGSEYEKFRHLLKKNIFMFSEGSVFKTQIKPEGKYENIRPDWNDPDMHDVWRCGMPVFIPVKL